MSPNTPRAPHWVALSGVTPAAHSLYEKILMFCLAGMPPSSGSLAELMGLSRTDKIRPYLDELAGIHAVTVSRRGMPGRNVFLANIEPPAGYCGPRTIAEWQAQHTSDVVYYIRRERDGAVKIGYTGGQVRHRITQLSRDYGRISLLAIEAGGPALEDRRHAQFASLRLPAEPANGGSEWFRLKTPLAGHVAALTVSA